MLAELEIENLAVIAHARIPFSPRLNVFTGETGAGKSILLHASMRCWGSVSHGTLCDRLQKSSGDGAFHPPGSAGLCETGCAFHFPCGR